MGTTVWSRMTKTSSQHQLPSFLRDSSMRLFRRRFTERLWGLLFQSLRATRVEPKKKPHNKQVDLIFPVILKQLSGKFDVSNWQKGHTYHSHI